MKKLSLIIAVLALIIGFNACKKDDEPAKESHLEKYFSVTDAELVNKNFPSASSSSNKPEILNLSGNPSVIPGGTNPIHIEADGSVQNILIGVKGEYGYYKLPATASKNTYYQFYLMISQDLNKDNFVIRVALRDSNGLISESQTINISRIEAGTGKLQVNCSWDQPNDVDLHLVEPNGTEIYYGNGVSQNGGELDVDSNPACSIDNINNENITYDDNDVVETGEYIVRVDLFSDCNVSNNTNYMVTAYYNGHILTTSSNNYPNPYSGSFVPTDADAGGAGSGVEVMRFNISNSKSMQLYQFNFGKAVKKVLSPEKLK